MLDALNTPMSASAAFFNGGPFADHRKTQEAHQRMAGAMLQQIGQVTLAVSNLAKAMARR